MLSIVSYWYAVSTEYENLRPMLNRKIDTLIGLSGEYLSGEW